MSVKSFRDVAAVTKESDVAKATASASTLKELISTIPRTYQAVLGDLLEKKYRIAHKHANVQATVATYDKHLKESSFPPLIRNMIKEPQLQFAKEYLGTTEGAESPSLFKSSVFTARKNVLTSALEEKQKELEALATLISPDVVTWQKAVFEVGKRTAASNGGQVTQAKDVGAVMTGVPATAATEFTTMANACQVYVYRVLALARASIDRSEIQKISKLKLKESADTEMMDVDGTATKERAVRDVIREELKAFKKRVFSEQQYVLPSQTASKRTNVTQRGKTNPDLPARNSCRRGSPRGTVGKMARRPRNLGRRVSPPEFPGFSSVVAGHLPKCIPSVE